MVVLDSEDQQKCDLFLVMVPSVKDRGEYRFEQLLRGAPGEHPVSQPQRVRAAV